MQLTEEIKQDFSRFGFLLKYYPKLQNNKEAVLIAVKQDGYVLEYVSKELRGDKEVVLIAVEQKGRALEFASEELKANKEVVMEAVKQNCWALQFASDELKADKDVVLEIFNLYKFEILSLVSAELQNELSNLIIEHLKK